LATNAVYAIEVTCHCSHADQSIDPHGCRNQSFGRASSGPLIRHLSEKGNARQGFFTDAEFHAVIKNLPEYLKDFAHFGYLTGWRRGEIASLRWEDLDGEAIRLRGENSKNGEGRTVPLEGELAHIIERRKAARQVKTKSGVILASFVFHNDGHAIVDIRKSWATACVAANVGEMLCEACGQAMAAHRCPQCKTETKYRGKLFHDFRRTGVRNMVRAGVPERVAMTISGHKTRSIFDRYNIVSERDLREAMQRTQEYLSAGQQEQQRVTKMKAAAAKQGG
jgi:integrase